ncbi:MAG: winged helix-turn-helix transcriptional regulator [Phycisphaerae bacterium]
MKRPTYTCGLEAALEIAGGKWTTLVLWHLASGPKRFGELRRLLPAISEKMLIQTLRQMQSNAIISRKDFHEIPPRVTYSLTPFGKSLTQALRPLCEWGARHMQRIATLEAIAQ